MCFLFLVFGLFVLLFFVDRFFASGKGTAAEASSPPPAEATGATEASATEEKQDGNAADAEGGVRERKVERAEILERCTAVEPPALSSSWDPGLGWDPGRAVETLHRSNTSSIPGS